MGGMAWVCVEDQRHIILEYLRIVRFIKNAPHASGSHTPDRRPFACLTD